MSRSNSASSAAASSSIGENSNALPARRRRTTVMHATALMMMTIITSDARNGPASGAASSTISSISADLDHRARENSLCGDTCHPRCVAKTFRHVPRTACELSRRRFHHGWVYMDWITNLDIWIALLTLTGLEIVLGIDNVIFIAILAGKLPADQQARA